MDKKVFLVSDCCYVESNPDHCVCSRCGEHCEVVVDDSLHAEMMNDFVESDYIPGYDDGEWDPIMGDADDYPETDDEWLDDFQGEEEFA
jgi:hypothetical protein